MAGHGVLIGNAGGTFTCSECAPGNTYAEADGDGDAGCALCFGCSLGTIAVTPCTTTSGRVCECLAGYAGMWGTQTMMCERCVSGETFALTQGWTNCVACTPSCGAQLELASCTTTADITCGACTACGSGTEEVSSCVAGVDRVCACSAGHASLQGISTKTCSACNSGANFANSAGQNACTACSDCGVGTFNSGCGPTDDRICQCLVGHEHVHGSDPFACEACGAGRFASLLGAACADCAVCGSGTQESTPCQSDVARTCECAIGIFYSLTPAACPCCRPLPLHHV